MRQTAKLYRAFKDMEREKYEIGRKINAFAFPRICFAFPGETLGSR